MKTKILFTIILASLWLGIFAQIIHVPADQPTIQAGINAAATSDTVLVDAGTYFENINFNGKAITVASNFIMDGDTNTINNTIINGSQPDNPDFASVVSFTTGEDTTSIISGFTITGGTGLLDASVPARIGGGIVCINAGAKIIHNKIISNEVDHQTTAFGAGIACTMYLQSKWIVIEHNIIADNYNHAIDDGAYGGGIFIGANTGSNIEVKARVSYNTIENNYCYGEIYRADGGGIKIEGSGGVNTMVYFNNNLVKNNSIRSKWTRGAGLCGISAGAEIANNDFSNNYIDTNSINFRGAAIIFKYPSGKVIIINNQFSNNVSPIVCESGTGAVNIMDGYETVVTVDGNIFTNNVGQKGGGFFSRRSYNLTVSNNVFSGNSADKGGALASYHPSGDESSPPLIVNNTFYGNSASDKGGAVRFIGELNAPLIFNCIFWENEATLGKDIFNESGLEMVISYSDINTDNISGLWTGEGNINEDPEFKDDSCHLDWPSLCVNAGTDSLEVYGVWYYSPLTDIDSDARPFEWTKPDIGADEAKWYYVGREESEAQDINSKLWSYPNPFSNFTTIAYELQQSSNVQITIYNHLGKQIEVIEKSQPQGLQKIVWSPVDLPNGVYYIRLQASGNVASGKMILMR